MSGHGCGELFQSAIDTLTSHVCVLDAASRIVCVNRAWRTFAAGNGWIDSEAGIGASYLDICDRAAEGGAASAAGFTEGLRAVMSGARDTYTQEYECHSPGELRWFVGRISRIGPADQPAYVVAHEPVTDRKRAERALQDAMDSLECQVDLRTAELVAANAVLAREVTARRETEVVLKRFESLVEHSRDIILFIGHPDGQILEANLAAQRAYGRTRDELLGLTIRDLQDDDTKSIVDRQVQVADSDGLLFETRHRRRDGTAFPVEVSTRGVTEAGDRMLLSVIRDISGRKRVEEERERLIAQLTEALERVKTLRGIVPICASCKKIREDSGYWEQVEVYLGNHTDAEFSHGLCPDCVLALYPDLAPDAGRDPLKEE